MCYNIARMLCTIRSMYVAAAIRKQQHQVLLLRYYDSICTARNNKLIIDIHTYINCAPTASGLCGLLCKSLNSLVLVSNYYSRYKMITELVGTCITCFTDSDITTKCWYWPDTDTDTRIDAATLALWFTVI